MKSHKEAIVPILLPILLVACSSAQTPSITPAPVVDPGRDETADLASMADDQIITRAEMAKFLLQAIHGEEYEAPDPVDGIFADVSGHWAEPWIEQLAVEGISTGDPEGRFHPDDIATRAEVAVFLLKAKHGSSYFPLPAAGNAFTDVAGHWAQDWIEQLKVEGISSGYSDGTFRPDAPLSAADLRMLLGSAIPNVLQ